MEFEKLYTAEDVAEITGLTLRTIRNYIKSGKLTGRRIGVQWRFTAADIQALFDTPGIPAGQSEAEKEEQAESFAAETAVTLEQAGGFAEGKDTETVTASSEDEVRPSGTAAAVRTGALSAEEEEEEPVSEAAELAGRFLQRRKAPRASACCIVDMPGMTEQEARFLWNRLQTLAAVYEDTPKRLEISFAFDENRDQARFTFSGSMEAACAMMNLCDVQ